MNLRVQPDFATYSIAPDDAFDLMGLLMLPAEQRAVLLRRRAEMFGADWVVQAFAQFMGLAASLESNTRDVVDLFRICELKEHPYSPEINIPTLTGALQGCRIAVEPTPAMCSSCAFRLGTPANQSPITTIDASDAAQDSFQFFCHDDMDESGEPRRLCAGYALARSQNKVSMQESEAR